MSAQVESMFYTGEAPWHRLGTHMTEKVYSSKEAIKLAGLDWTVSKRNSQFECVDEEGNVLYMPSGFMSIVRDSDNKELAKCGEGYQPLQNEEAFEFFDPFLREQDCFIETAGSLCGGKKIWALATICDPVDVVKDEPLQPHLLLANSHDGSIAVTVKYTYTRVVCNNTMEVALAEKGAFKKVRHTSQMKAQLQEVQQSVDLFKRSFDQRVLEYRELVNKQMTTEQFRESLEKLYASQLATAEKRLNRTATLGDLRETKKILQNFEGSPDLQGSIRGTAYAGYNAITQFYTHQKSSNSDSRVNALWFGQDAYALDRAKGILISC